MCCSHMSSLLINSFLFPKGRENAALNLRNQVLISVVGLKAQKDRVSRFCVINALTI